MNASALLLLATVLSATAAPLAKTVLYVTQTPMPDELLSSNHIIGQTKMTAVSAMQNPQADTLHAARGGALMIRYSDGSPPRNLTAAAGYGGAIDANQNYTGFQGASGLAVQRPCMHWSGTKAIFAMVAGAPATAADATPFHWQLYEITHFGKTETPVITYVQGQLAGYNNMQACYDTQDRIIFVSDAPHGGQTHLYPQLDEYLSLPCNTGLWRLDRANGNELKHIIHAPSGVFTPFIDSAGRVMFVQWDHQSRDVFATYDRPPITANGDAWTQTFNGNGTFATEAANAAFTPGTPANYAVYNSYPEPRNFDKTAQAGTNVNPNAFNQFFPWECHEDGSAHEVQNHAGRHELGGSTGRPSFTDDPNLVQLNFTHAVALNFLHLAESPASPGTFYAVNPPEFGTHCAAPIVRYSGGINVNPDTMQVTYVTPAVGVPNPALQSPLASPVDIYRNPTPLSDGSLLAVHAAVTQYDSNNGTDAAHPRSRYAFRLRMLQTSGATMVPDLINNPTTPANVNLTYYAGGTLVTYSGAPLWELDPVEVVGRNTPAQLTSPIQAVEQGVFNQAGVHAPTLQNWMKARNLALAANRNSTVRDAADKQQPFNLKVAWSNTQTIGSAGKVYDIGWVQLIQADSLRGYTYDGLNPNAPVQPGRRLMPVPLHDTTNEMPVAAGAPAGAVKLGDDGSWAAFVPAGRAVSWQMLDGAGTKSQIKERYWVTFAPGEVRTCAVCHGVNTNDQTGHPGAPTNAPQALAALLQFWKGNHPPGSVQHASGSVAASRSAGSVTLTVQRTGGNTGPVSVDFASAPVTAVPGTDYTPVNGTLNWSDGDAAPKSVTVPLLTPTQFGAGKDFRLTLSNPAYTAIQGPAHAVVTISEPPFQDWLWTRFGAASNTPAAGPAGDPDNDGVSNLLEYYLTSDPTRADQDKLPVIARDGPDFTFTFIREAGVAESGIQSSVQWATELTGPWSSAGVTEEVIEVMNAAGRQRIRATVPAAGASRLFLRLYTQF